MQQGKKRKGIGKKLRFTIFKRDGFVCQYCGAKPPEVKDAMRYACTRKAGAEPNVAMKYFYGTCWGIIKDRGGKHA